MADYTCELCQRPLPAGYSGHVCPMCKQEHQALQEAAERARLGRARALALAEQELLSPPAIVQPEPFTRAAAAYAAAPDAPILPPTPQSKAKKYGGIALLIIIAGLVWCGVIGIVIRNPGQEAIGKLTARQNALAGQGDGSASTAPRPKYSVGQSLHVRVTAKYHHIDNDRPTGIPEAPVAWNGFGTWSQWDKFIEMVDMYSGSGRYRGTVREFEFWGIPDGAQAQVLKVTPFIPPGGGPTEYAYDICSPALPGGDKTIVIIHEDNLQP